ncbi:hypothetical protein BOX17_06625 [Halomonas aestuarii]|uniref:DUF3592 domain-containing protein n=1 Tax=Halomonas aestuarii TaxID=1897729 RepID=A0A1J0VF42_9GAMM|nr:DUF3592 domain-containing protein [Halomonas aestuarii]APE30656.1 hypothetical protein BOX17_06625 [Halomonas aestuarii]
MFDIPLLIAIAALAGAAFTARRIWRRRSVNRWPEATATVTGTELVELDTGVQKSEGPSQERRYRARVHIAFRVDDREITSHNGRFDGTPTFTARREAEAYLAQYPTGMTLSVHYDPTTPSRTSFGAGSIPTRLIGLTLFLLAVSVFALLISLR